MQVDIPALARRLQQQKQQAAERYLANRRPNLFFQQYCRTIDRTLAELWPSFFDDGRFCLLAVGGYGRCEVYPYSDTDLALVSAAPLNAEEEGRMAGLVQTLWDLGLAPSLKAGTTSELCESARQDLTADTAFLEARFLCGNAGLAGQFIQTLNAQRHPAAFIEGKLLEMQQRHDKYAGFPLEPDVKNGAGCLRDIHTMLWLARAQGLHTDFYALARDKIITRMEAGLLRSSHRRLAQIRIELHLAAGREENRLIFDLQGTLAENRDLCRPDKQTGIEHLMRDFYRTAKTVMQLNGILIPMLRERVSLRGLKDGKELRQALKEAIYDLLKPLEKPLVLPENGQPFVMMMAGINGAGKTTSIGKLAKYFQKQGKSVMLAAGDTFRAAAREQLQEWGERNGVVVISQEKGDSAAVCFDAVEAAKARKIDVVLADTAGRLPTQLHLMEEIKKVKRVLQKAMPDAPHEIIVVLDANIGQNAVNQVGAFDDALGVTGLIVTKLDGTAKGGVLAALASSRAIPVRFIGVGERIDDLRPFNARAFVDALLDEGTLA